MIDFFYIYSRFLSSSMIRLNALFFPAIFLFISCSADPLSKDKNESIFVRIETSQSKPQIGQLVSLSLRARLPHIKWQIKPYQQGNYLFISQKSWDVILTALTHNTTNKKTDIFHDNTDSWILPGPWTAVEERHFVKLIQPLFDTKPKQSEPGDYFWYEWSEKNKQKFHSKMIDFFQWLKIYIQKNNSQKNPKNNFNIYPAQADIFDARLLALLQQKSNSDSFNSSSKSIPSNNSNKADTANKTLHNDLAFLWQKFGSLHQNLLPVFSIEKNNFSTLDLKYAEKNPPVNGILLGFWSMRFYCPGSYMIPIPTMHDTSDDRKELLAGKGVQIAVAVPFDKKEKWQLQELMPWISMPGHQKYVFLFISIGLLISAIALYFFVKHLQKRKTTLLQKINAKLELFHALDEIKKNIQQHSQTKEQTSKDSTLSLHSATELSYQFRLFLERELQILALEQDSQTLLETLQQQKLFQKFLGRPGSRSTKRHLPEIENLFYRLDMAKFAKLHVSNQEYLSIIDTIKEWAQGISNEKEIERQNSNNYAV